MGGVTKWRQRAADRRGHGSSAAHWHAALQKTNATPTWLQIIGGTLICAQAGRLDPLPAHRTLWDSDWGFALHPPSAICEHRGRGEKQLLPHRAGNFLQHWALRNKKIIEATDNEGLPRIGEERHRNLTYMGGVDWCTPSH
ncbi:hypothetical protein NDU88_007284 [Pleurodeles waltl]|uniref:Uncharacterized protein n=1 Tax=Pleurodeles waltl TaxID=8319 RepID=A0AAV7VTX4_PLEWA|nr:hypothetical protein NDU88_007284 [Pleurodeles waltl]